MQAWLDRPAWRNTPVFRKHDITLEILSYLTGPDIDRLELPTGPRRQLEVAIHKLGGVARAKTPIPHPERRQLTVMFCDLGVPPHCPNASTPRNCAS